MSIVVTGASGELGGMIAEELLARVDPDRIVLVSRSPERLARFRDAGATLRFGDFDRPESLAAAFEGAQTVMLVSTVEVGEKRRAQHAAAIRAARQAGAARIAYTSSVGIHPRNPSFIIPDHAFTEALLRECGLAPTILRMASYADILAHAIAPKAIADGQWISHAGDGCVGFVAKRDCARACAAVLADEGHEGATYEITGPELLSFHDAAALASAMSGVPIDYVEPEPDAEETRRQAETWIGPFTLPDLLSSETAVKQGFGAIVTHHVAMITGRPAQSLRELYAEAGIGAGSAP